MSQALLLTLALVTTGCGEDTWPPGLSCAEPSVDFGSTWEGSVLAHEFAFRMGPGEPLAVDKVRADCGCTTARLERLAAGEDERRAYAEGDLLQPGDQLFLGIEYQTRGKRGRVPREITLYTEAGTYQVEVLADVAPLLVFEPPGLDLGLLRSTESVRETVEVSSSDGRPFQLRFTGRGVPEAVTARPEPIAPDASGRSARWSVEVTVGPDMPLGPHLYTVELESDLTHEDGRAVAVQPWVRLKAVSRVGLEPQQIDFGAVPQEEMVSRTVRLSGYDDVPLPEPTAALVAAREQDAPLAELAQITVQAVPDQNAWDVQILLPALDGRLRGTFLGRLVVETGHPEEPRIEASLHGLALQRANGR